MLCTDSGADFGLAGKFSSVDFQYLKIELLPCTGVGCKPKLEIENYL